MAIVNRESDRQSARVSLVASHPGQFEYTELSPGSVDEEEFVARMYGSCERRADQMVNVSAGEYLVRFTPNSAAFSSSEIVLRIL